MLFAASVFRNLNCDDRVLDSNYYSLDLSRVDEINKNYSAFICPLANAFRDNFREIDRLTQFIKKLKIPCIVTGVGGQFEYDPDFSAPFKFDEKSKEFCYAVLDKSDSIGVRGELTATYLKKRLGIPENKIDVIGCPSLFYFGSTPPSRKPIQEFSEAIVSFHSGASIEKKVWEDIVRVSKYARNRYFVPQANYDLRILYNGIPFKKLNISYPTSLEHPLYRHNKVRFFTRADSWIEFYRKHIDYSIGIKIHGTIAAVLGGCQTLLIATDSRTRELAEFHKIPFIKHNSHKNIFDILDFMCDPMAMDQFYNNYRLKFDNFKDFMKRNNISFSSINHNTDHIKMIDNFEEGNVTPFIKLEQEKQISRMTEAYKELERRINLLKKA